jgi:hypothetical protein
MNHIKVSQRTDENENSKEIFVRILIHFTMMHFNAVAGGGEHVRGIKTER